MTFEESTARAQTLAKMAAEYNNTDPKKARKLYLEAAKHFKEASALSSKSKEVEDCLNWSSYFLSLSKTCKVQSLAVPECEEGGDAEQLVLTEIPNTSFNDIGGLEDVKDQIRKSIIYPFEHPELYKHYNVSAGGGIILYGPPGTGKTLIAKATAHECGAAFISIKCSDIMSKFVGDSEKHIKAIFEEARRHPRAIIFFDEFDSIGGRRADAQAHAKRIVDEQLAQMDGVESEDDKYLVIGATNAPWEIDPALRRFGRFGTMVHVKEPDHEAREAIFKIHLKNRPCGNINYQSLAIMTKGYSGADISAICEESALIPLGEALQGSTRRDICMSDLLVCIEKRTSSVLAWYSEAEKMIKKYGDSVKI